MLQSHHSDICILVDPHRQDAVSESPKRRLWPHSQKDGTAAPMYTRVLSLRLLLFTTQLLAEIAPFEPSWRGLESLRRRETSQAREDKHPEIHSEAEARNRTHWRRAEGPLVL